MRKRSDKANLIGDLAVAICPEVGYNTVPLVVKLDH